jgi:hypothetical protein
MRDVKDDFQWYGWFKSKGYHGMVYAFYFKNKLLKIGCSYAKFNTRSKQNKSFGERLIRQINNLPGQYRKNPSDLYIDGYGFIPVSPNGRDIVDTIQEFERINNIKIKIEEIYLHIWDISDVESTKYRWFNDDLGNKEKARYFEGQMIAQYKMDNNDQLPIGNSKQDPSVWNKAYRSPKMAKEAADLFNS